LQETALTLARVGNPACQVVAVSVNTQHLSEADALTYMAGVEAEMDLPTVDPFRQGASRLVDALAGIKGRGAAVATAHDPAIVPDA
jgi:uncharacterized NAD-dependent epimerase/dehydratase family protein